MDLGLDLAPEPDEWGGDGAGDRAQSSIRIGIIFEWENPLATKNRWDSLLI